MSDPLMEEIWRVREQLVVEHGGMDGLLKHVKKIEQVRLHKVAEAKKRRHESNATKATKRKNKSTQ